MQFSSFLYRFFRAFQPIHSSIPFDVSIDEQHAPELVVIVWFIVCHNDELVSGDFRTTGLNYFRPAKTKFWKLKGSFIKSETRMCARCGAITLFGDMKSLESVKVKLPDLQED